MNIDLNSLKPFIAKINSWIDGYIRTYKERRVPVANIGFSNLAAYFSSDMLNYARVAYVEQIEPPPLRQIGLDGFSFFESLNAGGITYKDTFFITKNLAKDESIHFHELVHIIQWDELGAADFILTYGAGLLQFGYRQCPLEAIAYGYQCDFDRGLPIKDLESKVRSHCRNLAGNIA